jgi:outer membrane protein OmpA-like peptidoglycan-associated protein
MPLVRRLPLILSVALLSTTLFAKTDPDAGQEKTIAPFVKSTRTSLEYSTPARPLPQPVKVRTRTVYPPGSISGSHYWGFEAGVTAGQLMGGDLNIVYPYPYDRLNRGDTMSVRFSDHSIAVRYSIGAVADYALSPITSLQGKLAFRMLGATATKNMDFICFGAPAMFTESYEMDLGYLSMDLLSRIQFLRDSWYGLAGFGVSALVTSRVDAIESISSPNQQCQYTYNNNGSDFTGQYVAQSLDADVEDDLVGGRFDLRFGIGTFIPISSGMVLTPELTVGIPMNAVVDPATNDRTGIRTDDPPSHPYASLTVGLKFPWGDNAAKPYTVEDTLADDPNDRKVIGYIEIRDGDNLQGRIVDEAGNVIRDGSVVVVDLGTNRIVATDDAKDGSYSLHIEEPGRYSVTADAPGYLFGSTMFEIDEDGHIMKQAGDIKLSRSADGRVRLLIFFESNKAVLQASSYPELNRAAALMVANPTMDVEIAGYTDSKGSDAYNLELSQKRANAVKEYIAGQGVELTRLTAIGYGEASPIATNETEEGRADNRRVEFVVRRK